MRTEANWHSSADPDAMLALITPQIDERILRLFFCECCRRIWDLITDERSRQAVEAAERVAMGAIKPSGLLPFRHAARLAVCEAKRAEWKAEADADFLATPDYCELA